MAEDKQGRRKERIGIVVSDKMDKTVVVAVESFRRHRIYKKILRRTARYKAHDEANEAKIGDLVRISETRPLSKLKRWRVAEIVEQREVAETKPVEVDAAVIEEFEVRRRQTDEDEETQVAVAAADEAPAAEGPATEVQPTQAEETAAAEAEATQVEETVAPEEEAVPPAAADTEEAQVEDVGEGPATGEHAEEPAEGSVEAVSDEPDVSETEAPEEEKTEEDEEAT